MKEVILFVKDSFQDKKTRFVLFLLIVALVTLWTTWRSEGKANVEDLIKRIEKCERSHMDCMTQMLIMSEKWNAKLDSIYVKYYRAAIELENFKKEIQCLN